MAATHLSGPLFVGGKLVATLDPLTGVASSLVVEGEYRSLVLQTGGPAADVPRNVIYGAGGISNTGVVSVAANGEIDILKAAAIMFKTRLRAGRVGAAGVSILIIWGEVSTDGGGSWVQLPNVSSINLSVATDTITFADIVPLTVLPGYKFRIRFARSSLGDNSGDLTPQAQPAGLNFLGPVPSAYMSIYRFTSPPTPST
jgi:hypothetical protein